MAKTIRRKSYVPDWVVRKYIRSVDITGGHYLLEGDERKKQLRWWHEDKTSWYRISPPKYFRKCEESRYKTMCNTELQKWERDNDYEVSIVERLPYQYWD